MTYKVYHISTGECLGEASSIWDLSGLIMDLFYDDGIWPHEVRVEEVEDE